MCARLVFVRCELGLVRARLGMCLQRGHLTSAWGGFRLNASASCHAFAVGQFAVVFYRGKGASTSQRKLRELVAARVGAFIHPQGTGADTGSL